ncbi:MAG: hypothetical protein WCS43_06290 [Verrucomicrobiota bacterium]
MSINKFFGEAWFNVLMILFDPNDAILAATALTGAAPMLPLQHVDHHCVRSSCC